MADITKIQHMNNSTQYLITTSQVSEPQLNKVNITNWINTSANIHNHETQGEMLVRRFFASDDAENYSASYDLPCVDSHNLIFSIDKGTSWNRVLSLDMRSNDLYARAKTNNTWGNWEKIVRNTGTWGISITGNAATATALTSNAGSSTVPIYFSGGKPVQCSTTLGVSITGSSASCTGNAATATKATQDGSGNTITSKYVTVDTAQSISGVKTFSAQQKLAGGFITGSQATSGSGSGVNIGTDGGIEIFHNSTPFIDFHYQYATKDYSVRLICNGDGQLSCTGKFYGAVWNDYAEYRETKESIEPGRCIVETGNGDLILSTKRLQEGCEIVSDTFGFAIGQNEKNNTPTAASGIVLTYLYENKEQARPGQPVCSGPNGTVSLMTNEEAREWPWCIIGTISEIPNYDIWYAGSNKDHPIKVDGRIWIKVR